MKLPTPPPSSPNGTLSLMKECNYNICFFLSYSEDFLGAIVKEKQIDIIIYNNRVSLVLWMGGWPDFEVS